MRLKTVTSALHHIIDARAAIEHLELSTPSELIRLKRVKEELSKAYSLLSDCEEDLGDFFSIEDVKETLERNES